LEQDVAVGVAISGGGSRAALFGASVLEALSRVRTPDLRAEVLDGHVVGALERAVDLGHVVEVGVVRRAESDSNGIGDPRHRLSAL
jgi:hypothetical protein